MVSRIHTCYTGIASWFMKSVAGIRPDPAHPAYQSFIIQPVVGGDLTFAEGQTESPYGTIRSRWQRDGDRLTLVRQDPATSWSTPQPAVIRWTSPWPMSLNDLPYFAVIDSDSNSTACGSMPL